MKKNSQFSTPILFLIFNRPETEKRVFEQIRKIKPKHLFVVADGPRRDRLDDIERCSEARNIIDQGIDWPCKVTKLYRTKNLGCGVSPAEGITWFFSKVDYGIILEDDCLPNLSFFRYCEELLLKYKDDERIMAISGDNFQFGKNTKMYSYYFSRYPHCWGWATWRRAWDKFDFNIKLWPEIKKYGLFRSILDNNLLLVKYWSMAFDYVYSGSNDIWSYQWLFACWASSGLSILPAHNLVKNIGVGINATHTSGKSKNTEQETKRLAFPLKHPTYLIRDRLADHITDRNVFLKIRVIGGIVFNYFFKNGEKFNE